MGCTDAIFLADTAVESTKLANSSIATFHLFSFNFLSQLAKPINIPFLKNT